VPDEVILDLLTPPLVAAAEQGGYILDGFPRGDITAEILARLDPSSAGSASPSRT
jgi:hypothetical protein